MTLIPAGTATNGFTGALVLKSLDAGGTVLYFPSAVIDPTVYDGKDAPMLINNEAFPTNETQGTSYGVIGVTCPLIAGLQNADFFSRAVGSGVGDTGLTGYWTVTVYPDNQSGDNPVTYGLCKFGSVRLRSMFSTQANQQITWLDFQLLSCDPESTVVAALAAPATGALSTGKILGFGQSAFTGLTNVVQVTMDVSTGLQFIPGNVAGNNAAYPSLPAGLKQNTIDGVITFRQARRPTTTIDGDGTVVTAFGKTAAGVSFTTQVMRLSTNKRITGGINYRGVPYRIKSNDGASPLVFADL